MKQTKSYTLANGVRIILMPSTQTVDVGICVAVLAGSRFEQPGEGGITHLLEHLMMNGYRDRSCRSFADFARLVSQSAIDFNATTTESTLYFTVEAKRKKVNECIELVARTVLHPSFNKTDLRMELLPIQLEGHSDRNDVPSSTNESALDLLYRGHTLSSPICGTTQSLRKITVKEIRRWYRTILRSDNVVCAIAGNFEPANVEPTLEKRFGKLPRHGRLTTKPFSLRQNRPRLLLQPSSSPIVDICIAFPTFGFSHPDRFAVSLLKNHFGDLQRWDSRLHLALRGEKKLVYSAWSQLWHHRETGSFALSTATVPEHLLSALRQISLEINRVRAMQLTDAELRLTKERVKMGARDRKYTPSSMVEFHAQQALITGVTIADREFCDMIEMVDAADIQKTARELFNRNRMCIVLKGSVSSVDRRRVLSALHW